jgi:O-antigen/teichoic acid export membrane protein
MVRRGVFARLILGCDWMGGDVPTLNLSRLGRPGDSFMTSLRGGALAGMLARAAGMGGAFAMSVAILQTLPKSDAGLLLLVYTLLTMAAALGRFGADNLALREVSKAPRESAALIRHSFVLCLLLSPIGSALLVGALLLQGGHTQTIPVAVAAAVAVLPAALSIVAGAVLRGLSCVAAGTLAELGSPLVIATVGICALGAAGRANATSVMWVLVFGYVVTAGWAWAAVASKVPGLVARPTGFGSYLRTFRTSLAAFFTTTMGFFLFTWMPVLALGYFITDRTLANEGVAVFNAGARLAQFVPLISTIQISYLSQRFASLHHQGNVAELSRLSQRSTLVAMLWAVPLAAFMLIAPTTALGIFGDYSAAEGTLRILVGAALIVAATGPVNGLLLTCGHERAAGRYTLVLLVVSAIALPLLSRWGPAGVAWGSAAISILYAFVGYITLRRDGIAPAFGSR